MSKNAVRRSNVRKSLVNGSDTGLFYTGVSWYLPGNRRTRELNKSLRERALFLLTQDKELTDIIDELRKEHATIKAKAIKKEREASKKRAAERKEVDEIQTYRRLKQKYG